MSIGMAERKPVELVATMFGGSVREECVPNARSIWRWSQTGNEKVKNTLNVIRPYLIVKRQQAELVLELIDNWHIPHKRNDGVPIWEIQRRQDLYIKVRKLNAVGAAATTERKSIREDEATVCSVSKDAEDSRNDYPANLTLVNK